MRENAIDPFLHAKPNTDESWSVGFRTLKTEMDALKRPQAETAAKLDTLFPGILDLRLQRRTE